MENSKREFRVWKKKLQEKYGCQKKITAKHQGENRVNGNRDSFSDSDNDESMTWRSVPGEKTPTDFRKNSGSNDFYI